jgi:biotin transport system substrate-specific component
MNSTLVLRRSNLFDMVFPQADSVTKVILVLACSGLMALSSRVALPLPFTPVPVTGQTAAVLLLASVLGARLALSVQLVYLAEGLAGLPVFAPGTDWGAARLAGPTGGYLVGFLAATWIIGTLADRGVGKRFLSALGMMLAGEAAMYAVALPWLKGVTGVRWTQALLLGVWPFLPGDVYKMALVGLLLPVSWRVIRKSKGPSN